MPTQPTVFLDFETHDNNKEGFALPVQIGVCDIEGRPLLTSYIALPDGVTMTAEASSVHGITPEMLQNAPTFYDLEPQLWDIFDGKRIVIYNKMFDMSVLLHAYHFARLLMPLDYVFDCAMERYAREFGAKNKDGTPRWWKLGSALEHQYGSLAPLAFSAHNALADAQMTAALWRMMENTPQEMRRVSSHIPLLFTHYTVAKTVKGSNYLKLSTMAGTTVNLFDSWWEAVSEVVDVKDCIKVAFGNYDKLHTLAAPLPLLVDFSGEWPEVRGLDRDLLNL